MTAQGQYGQAADYYHELTSHWPLLPKTPVVEKGFIFIVKFLYDERARSITIFSEALTAYFSFAEARRLDTTTLRASCAYRHDY